MHKEIIQQNKIIVENEQYTLNDKVYELHDLLTHTYQTTEFYPADFDYQIPSPPEGHPIVEVTKESTIECIIRLLKEGFTPCALNFANAYHPGGGYIYGARAQEEACCRCSALYFSLIQPQCNIFYETNYEFRETSKSNEATDALIFSPDVPIFRDQDEELIEPITCSFITSPAVDLHYCPKGYNQEKLDAVMLPRVRKIIQLAILKQQKTIILGAFGCGAFLQNAKFVSKYFEQVMIKEGYANFFDKIVYAIYRGPPENYLYFTQLFAPQQLTESDLKELKEIEDFEARANAVREAKE